MDPPASTRSATVEERRLRVALEGFLSRERRTDVVVTGWRREASPFAVAGVFPVEVLRVELEGGEEVPLFVKHLGQEQADHPDKQCRDREPRIYEELLSDDGLPAPRYYGSRRNAVTGRREVYLEYVGDWSLEYQELDGWFVAARRLAHLHAHFARRADDLFARDYLLRLDAAYFQRWALRALEEVAECAEHLTDELGGVVDGYGRIAELLAAQPATLVHNDLAPKNVLADRARKPVRIAFVDWEMTGVGCGLLDLVHLKDGLDGKSDQRMRAAYCAELDGTGLLPPSGPALESLFAACNVHLILSRLAFSRALRLPAERMARWIAEARYLSGRVERGDGS